MVNLDIYSSKEGYDGIRYDGKYILRPNTYNIKMIEYQPEHFNDIDGLVFYASLLDYKLQLFKITRKGLKYMVTPISKAYVSIKSTSVPDVFIVNYNTMINSNEDILFTDDCSCITDIIDNMCIVGKQEEWCRIYDISKKQYVYDLTLQNPNIRPDNIFFSDFKKQKGNIYSIAYRVRSYGYKTNEPCIHIIKKVGNSFKVSENINIYKDYNKLYNIRYLDKYGLYFIEKIHYPRRGNDYYTIILDEDFQKVFAGNIQVNIYEGSPYIMIKKEVKDLWNNHVYCLYDMEHKRYVEPDKDFDIDISKELSKKEPTEPKLYDGRYIIYRFGESIFNWDCIMVDVVKRQQVKDIYCFDGIDSYNFVTLPRQIRNKFADNVIIFSDKNDWYYNFYKDPVKGVIIPLSMTRQGDPKTIDELSGFIKDK